MQVKSDVIRTVTFLAFDFFMLAQEGEAGLFVVERIFALRPMNQLEFLAIVIAVTLTAGLPPALHSLEMESPLGLENLFNFQVTGQTLGLGGPATNLMAFCAIPKPLKKRMRFCQVTWRELG